LLLQVQDWRKRERERDDDDEEEEAKAFEDFSLLLLL
jgi:hypothetical protein